MNIPKKYIKFLEKVADSSEEVGGSKHAACLVYKKKVLSWGVNKEKSHPLQLEFSDHPEKIYLHAEIDCLVKSIRDFDEKLIEKSTLYIARFAPSGVLLSKPCKGCQRAIKFYNIKKVIHS